jgi:hypothetical protein
MAHQVAAAGIGAAGDLLGGLLKSRSDSSALASQSEAQKQALNFEREKEASRQRELSEQKALENHRYNQSWQAYQQALQDWKLRHGWKFASGGEGAGGGGPQMGGGGGGGVTLGNMMGGA